MWLQYNAGWPPCFPDPKKMMPVSRRNAILIGAAYILLAVLFRCCSFFPLVIDHDESTYLVIANELLKGKMYWIDVFDTKPIGIFLLYAGFLKIAGHSIILIRLLTALWVGLTAWLIWDIQRKWMPTGPGPWISGVFYLAMISLFTFYGVSPNTEIYFSSLTIVAIWLVMHWPWRWWSMMTSGLAIGMGVMIKQAAAFDATALGLFLLWLIWKEGRKPLSRLARMAVMTMLAAVPLALVAWWYARQGHLTLFLDHQFFLPGRYLDQTDQPYSWRMIVDFLARYAPVTALAIFVIVRRTKVTLPAVGFYGSWLLLACLAAILPRNAFGHYFIALIPPMAMLAGLAWHPDLQFPQWMQWLRSSRVGYILLALFILVNGIFQYHDYIQKPDHVRTALSRIRESGIEHPTIFTGTSNFQILYVVLNTSPPVGYPHPSLLFDDRFDEVLNIDHQAQFNQVRSTAPSYCFFNWNEPKGLYEQWIAEDYLAIDTLGKVVMFERMEN